MFHRTPKVNMPMQAPHPARREPQPSRFLTVQLFAQTVGYTEKAVYRKIEDGVWRESFEYVRAPDGRVLVVLDGFEDWVMKK